MGGMFLRNSVIFYGAEGKGKWQNAGGASLETFEESLQALSIAKKNTASA